MCLPPHTNGHAVVKVILEIYHETDSPASLYLATGNYVLWIRYGEWLLTCPVILIHLSNITVRGGPMHRQSFGEFTVLPARTA